MRRIVLLPFIICLFFTLAVPVFAVTTTITAYPNQITPNPFDVNVSISGATSGINYLRVELYKEGSTNYFGETEVAQDNWYNGSDGTSYFPVQVDSSKSWSGTVSARIGSPTTTDYDGLGNYRLRIRRYTASGNYTASEADTSSVLVTIAVPTQTPTPIVTATPTDSPTPTKIPSPTKTPTPTKSPTPTTRPTSVPTTVLLKSTVSHVSQTPTATPTAAVLAASTATSSSDFADDIQEEKPVVQNSSNKGLLFLSLGVGALFIGGGVGYFVYNKKKGFNGQENY